MSGAVEPKGTIELVVVKHGKNPAHCVYLNSYRIAGQKPWGGGDTTASWDVSLDTLRVAIPELRTTRAPDPAVAVLEAEVMRLRAQYEDEHQARLSLQNFAADERDVSIALLMLLSEVRIYVTDALEAYEHTDGRDLLNRINIALNPAPSEKEAG